MKEYLGSISRLVGIKDPVSIDANKSEVFADRANSRKSVTTLKQYKMSGKKGHSKKMKKLKMDFLLGSEKYWLVEEDLMPLYSHLVDGYSKFTIENSVIEVTSQVNQVLESLQLNSSSNNIQV